VRLAALDLREISGGGSGCPGLDPGILRFPRFHLFYLNVTFMCKFPSNPMDDDHVRSESHRFQDVSPKKRTFLLTYAVIPDEA